MSEQPTFPQTLQDAVVYFSDPDRALQFFIGMRWPAGIVCSWCGHDQVSFISTRRIWKCKSCKKQFSAKVRSVMEDSPLGLDKWLCCLWVMVNAKNAVSSYEIARALGIKQESAWFMLHRLRHALQMGTLEKLEGVVEIDETFIGGFEKNRKLSLRKNPKRVVPSKAVVFGLLERSTKTVRTKHVPNTSAPVIQAEVRANVKEGSEIQSDEAGYYRSLANDYVHKTVNHLRGYVREGIHSNNIESYWNLFKRCYKGTWTHLSGAHLQAYLDEQAFRFNTRETNDGLRFAAAAMQLSGKRLTYKELTERGLTTLAE